MSIERRTSSEEIVELLQEIINLQTHTEETEGHQEEHRFLRELIENAREEKELKKAIRDKIIKNTAWLGFLAAMAGVWYLFIEQIKHAVT